MGAGRGRPGPDGTGPPLSQVQATMTVEIRAVRRLWQVRRSLLTPTRGGTERSNVPLTMPRVSRHAFGCMARHGSSHAWRTSRYAALPPRGLAGPNRRRRSLADGKARRGSIRLAWRTRLPSVQTAFSAAFSHADAYHTGYLGVEGVEVRRPTFPLGWAGEARRGRVRREYPGVPRQHIPY